MHTSGDHPRRTFLPLRPESRSGAFAAPVLARAVQAHVRRRRQSEPRQRPAKRRSLHLCVFRSLSQSEMHLCLHRRSLVNHTHRITLCVQISRRQGAHTKFREMFVPKASPAAAATALIAPTALIVLIAPIAQSMLTVATVAVIAVNAKLSRSDNRRPTGNDVYNQLEFLPPSVCPQVKSTVRQPDNVKCFFVFAERDTLCGRVCVFLSNRFEPAPDERSSPLSPVTRVSTAFPLTTTCYTLACCTYTHLHTRMCSYMRVPLPHTHTHTYTNLYRYDTLSAPHQPSLSLSHSLYLSIHISMYISYIYIYMIYTYMIYTYICGYLLYTKRRLTVFDEHTMIVLIKFTRS
jgi:hypothetical protein